MPDFPVQQTVTLVLLRLESGERLPTLVDDTTWLPLRFATRWAVRYRRYHVQASTLTSDLRVVGKVYQWATSQGISLDDYLAKGAFLSARQIESLAHFFRQSGVAEQKSVAPAMYDHHVCIARDFFCWAIEDIRSKGRYNMAQLEILWKVRTETERLFDMLLINAHPSQRIKPLTDEEVTHIRQTIAPQQTAPPTWIFPKTSFSVVTSLRKSVSNMPMGWIASCISVVGPIPHRCDTTSKIRSRNKQKRCCVRSITVKDMRTHHEEGCH